MTDVRLAPLPPEAAMAYLRSKGLAPPDARFDWRDLWRGEHAASFVVAKAAQDDVLEAIRGAILEAQAEGKPIRQAAAELAPRLQEMGWWGRRTMTDPLTGESKEVQLGSMHRLRTIFDTNMRTAAAAGRWAMIQRTKAAFPYLRYHQIDRPTRRLQHRRFHGLVRPVDDPVWARIYPPNGWYCGCSVEQITQGQIDRGQVTVSPPFDLEEVEWENERTGETEQLPRGVHPGFDVNPGMIWLDMEGRMEALAGQDNHAALVGVASELRLRVLNEQLERGVLVDRAGQVRHSLRAAPDERDRLTWRGLDVRGLDLLHSHPFEGLFSPTDYNSLFSHHLRSIAFVTPQGSFASLFGQDVAHYPAARAAFTRRVAAMQDELDALLRAERNVVMPHALGLWLDRSGVAAYHLEPTGALRDVLTRHADLIGRLANDLHPE